MTHGPLRGEVVLPKTPEGYAGTITYFGVPVCVVIERAGDIGGVPAVRVTLYDAPLPAPGEPMPEYLRCAVLDDPEPAREKPVQSAPVRIRDHGDDAIPDLCGPAVQDALL